MDGWDGWMDGWVGMVNIGHRSSQSTFCTNNDRGQMIMIKTNNMEVANLKQCTAYTCKVSYPKVNGVGPHLDKLLWENYKDYNMTVMHTLI